MLISELIIKNHCALELLEKYSIDYYCNGHLSMEQTLLEKNISLVKFLNELEVCEKLQMGANTDYSEFELDELYKHIKNTHHQIIRSMTVEIKNFISMLEANRIILELSAEFDRLAEELNAHLSKEEGIVFPIIKHLVFSQKFNEKPKRRSYGTIKKTIERMLIDHKNSSARMETINLIKNKLISNQSKDYKPKVLFDKLSMFEKDLHFHIHLENNILFPKSIELEERLSKK